MEINPHEGWRPRDYQKPAWNYWVRDDGKHLELIWNRRSGKDDIALKGACVLAHKRPANYWHMLPQAGQVRKAIWEAVNPHTGKKRIDEAFPLFLRAATKDNDMMIRFKNGSTWQALGSDNFENAIGSTPAGIVYSEWAQANPSVRGYLRPIIAENNGWQAFITTPRGKNHAYKTFEAAKNNPSAFAEILTVEETKVLDGTQLELEREEYIATYGQAIGEALFQQEYYCSFNAPTLGAVYGSELDKARRDGRIASFPYEEEYAVHTAWDLGHTDYTAIWFFQVVNREIKIIDFYQNNLLQIKDYVKELQNKPYVYGRHLMPHDAHDGRYKLATGETLAEMAEKLGLKGIKEVPKLPNNTAGIQQVRKIFSRFHFDEEKCEEGLSALEAFHYAWDDNKKSFKDKPAHDWASHPSDALMYLAVGIEQIAVNIKPKEASRTPRAKSRQRVSHIV